MEICKPQVGGARLGLVEAVTDVESSEENKDLGPMIGVCSVTTERTGLVPLIRRRFS